MHQADFAEGHTVARNRIQIARVLVTVGCCHRREGKRLVFHIVRQNRQHFCQFKIQRFGGFGFGEERHAQFFVLHAQVVFVHTIHRSADFKHAEIGRKRGVCTHLTKLGRYNGFANGLDIRVGRIDEFNIVLDFHTECLVIIIIRPNIGMQFIQRKALDQNILDFVLHRLFFTHTHGVQRRLGCMHIEIVIPVNAGNFLNKVRFNRDIFGGAVTRHIDRETIPVGFDAEAQGLERFDHRIVWNINPCVAV